MFLLRNKIRYTFLIFNLCLFAGRNLYAQNLPDSLKDIPQPDLGPNDTIKVPARIIDREIVPGTTLPWVWISVPYPPELLKKRQERTRLRNAVYVTYPYARKAGYIINDINAKLAGIPDKSDKKKYMRSREQELKKEFGDPLKNLSVYQGKVLMKLINRQTGNNCYDIIKEYKGGFNARIFQTVAFVFGSNLKQDYDASGDDRAIEGIVNEIERMYGKR
jgi:hypothetical protein